MDTTALTVPHACDVLIVGAGPAGLSFARRISASGLRVVIVEKSPLESIEDPAYDGREIALTHRSKRMMTELNMWGKVPPNEIYPLKDARVVNGNSDYQLYFRQPTKALGKRADSLGFLISNHNIKRAAFESLVPFDNVTILANRGVREVKVTDSNAEVTLENNERYTAALLVAADSRFSQTRRQVGISADIHDFGRTVIVFRMRHTISNNHSAFECFHYGQTLALLPLEETLTNCVVTIAADRADEILSLAPDDLAAHISAKLKGRLGDMELAGSIHTYPLVGVHANAFYAKRTALIGDAAVGMHPVTAHGFNLGLASADILGNLVVQAAHEGRDIGTRALLAAYQRRHMPHTKVMYHGTNAMVQLFTNESLPVKALRSAILRLSNNLPPVKALISRQLTG